MYKKILDLFIKYFNANFEEATKIENILELNHYLKYKNSFKIFHAIIRHIAKYTDELNIYLRQFNNKFEVIVLTDLPV